MIPKMVPGTVFGQGVFRFSSNMSYIVPFLHKLSETTPEYLVDNNWLKSTQNRVLAPDDKNISLIFDE